MRRNKICVCRLITLLVSLLYSPSVSAQTVLNFDDISAPLGSYAPMPPGYGGINWPSGTGVFREPHPQPPYFPQSHPNGVGLGIPVDVVAENIVTFIGGPKVFDGAYF